MAAAHRNVHDAEPPRRHFQSADSRRRAENSARGCFSLHERYQRLKNGIFSRVPFEGSREKSLSFGALTSTKRGILEDVQSGELPQPGMHRHLGKRVKEELQRSAEGSQEEDRGIPEHGRVPQEPCHQPRQWETLDLYEQNQIWMDEIATRVHFEHSDLRYTPSVESSSDSETDVDDKDCDEDRLVDDTPFRNRPSLPPICPANAESSSSRQGVIGPDALVELARNGEFSELWSALKRARLEQNRRQDSDVDAETMYYTAVDTFLSEWQEAMSVIDNESTGGESHLARRSVYFDAADSLQSKETDVPSMSGTPKRLARAMAIGTSFQTCDTWFPYGSSVLESGCQTPVHGVTPIEEWQRSVRRIILERTLPRKQKSRQSRCVIVLTKGPKVPPIKEQPRRYLSCFYG